MKTYRSLAIAMLFVAATTVQAQDLGKVSQGGNADSERHSHISTVLIVKNYLRCLDSEFPTVVESALGHVTYMRIALPSENLGAIKEKLVSLTTNGSTLAVRYKAFTALEVYGNPAAFRRFIDHRNGNGDGILDEISLRIMPKSDLVAR